jgi:hypothetical protein
MYLDNVGMQTKVRVFETQGEANVFMAEVEQKGGEILDAKFAGAGDYGYIFKILILYRVPKDA